MGRNFTAVLLAVSCLCGGAKADVVAGSQRNILGWNLAAYDRNGAFSHCAMFTPYKSGITLYYTIFGDYTWRVGWSHPSWNFTTGQQVPISVVVDGGAPTNLTATAISKTFATADLPATSGFFDLMRKGFQMSVYAQGSQYAFNLDGTYAALTELISCVNGFARSARPPAPIVGAPSAPPPTPSASLSVDQRLEATTLVANLLSQGDLNGFRILTSKEIQDLKISSLSSWHVVWKAENVFGTMKIVPPNAAKSPADIATAMIADDSRGCTNGKFASGTSPDDKSPGTMRLFVACKTDKLAWETHYIVAPRDEGGYYLFGTFGLSQSEDASASVTHADGLLRAAVFQVLKH